MIDTPPAATLQVLELHAGALRLALRPDLGGSIAGLWFDTLPVLRSTEPTELSSSRLAGSYPLVPYSGRLGYRRFRWQGAEHTTAPNFDDNPHSLHGVAWQRDWAVLESTQTATQATATLGYVHKPDAHWPFAFQVQQRFELTAESLLCHLHITNTHTQPQPVGLGWHPYFPKRQRSRLHVELAERWDSDASGLPTRKVMQPGIDGDVAHLAFDHCFEGWRGPARLRDEKLSVKLTSNLPYLVVFTPPEKAYYCVEPVSHVSNAIHMASPTAHGLRTLAPGEATEGWMRLDVQPA